MAVTWNVVALKAIETIESLSNVVTAIHWTANDTDGDHTGSCYGSIGLAEADSETFIAYDSITKENAIAWAKAALGDEEVMNIETSISNQIKQSKTPTTTTGVPWS